MNKFTIYFARICRRMGLAHCQRLNESMESFHYELYYTVNNCVHSLQRMCQAIVEIFLKNLYRLICLTQSNIIYVLNSKMDMLLVMLKISVQYYLRSKNNLNWFKMIFVICISKTSELRLKQQIEYIDGVKIFCETFIRVKDWKSEMAGDEKQEFSLHIHINSVHEHSAHSFWCVFSNINTFHSILCEQMFPSKLKHSLLKRT